MNYNETIIDLLRNFSNDTKVKNLFGSFSNYTKSIIDIGYGSSSDKTLTIVLVTASLLLSIASGYTTYQGLTQYSYGLIAFIITLGIQGLLFASSWKLGQAFVIKDYNLFLIAIWFMAMVASVFFSYSSLFEHIYKTEEREHNRDIVAATESQKILSHLNRQLQTNLIAGFKDWKLSINDLLKEIEEVHNKKLLEIKAEHRRLKEIAKDEFDKGGTVYFIDGKKFITTKGDGDFYKEYLNNASNYVEQVQKPYEAKLDKYNNYKVNLLSILNDFEAKLKVSYLRKAIFKCEEIKRKFGNASQSCELSSLKADDIKAFEMFKQECSVNNLNKGFHDDLIFVKKCVTMSNISENLVESQLDEISNIEKTEGPYAHSFIIVTNELKRLHPLAIGTLALALIIDILILLCSLLGSKHESFLTINSYEDLTYMGDRPLEVVLDTTLEKQDGDTMLLKRIKDILNHAKFDLKAARDGYPAILTFEQIQELNLHKELGVLFSRKLAKPLESNSIIGMKTKLILWMCDQILRKRMSIDTYKDFETLRKG